MTSSIKKVSKDFKILEYEEKALFSLSSKGNKIKVFDQDILEDIMNSRFNKKYRELLYLVMCLNEDEDATDSDCELALIKIDSFRDDLINRYYKYLGKERVSRYLQMLILLEEKLNSRRKGKGR